MKKCLSAMLALIILLSLTACAGNDKEGDKTDGSAKTTTLMVYMIGSDLEAKSSAGTNDLAEIEKSGINTDKNNVVIYTGGSPKWHNDFTDSSKNIILTLTENGFKEEESVAQTSMGEAETLTYFMDYCVKNRPAEHYELILWDHGNGPLIGYGKDMLFDNDSLTLAEMDEAMKASPFTGDSKLDWVGFDACLMSSAELVCVWKNYADYLIASQEVEPSFGWTYDFLKNLGDSDTKDLTNDITGKYLETCLAYFEKKGYKDRDTTLACMDLSCADELNTAVNGLFAKAKSGVSASYDALAAARVSTRALGRASTGSEYDLVDLKDLSEQMKGAYPEQSKALSDTIDKMVVSNATNGVKLSGLSLYYPFYNKDYYKNSWSKTYKELNIFSDYAAYLAEYEKTWLKEDMLTGTATSETPEGAEGKYTLKLTDDQLKHYASAKYYILQKDGTETYTKLFSSADVSLSGNTLSANFDGSVIYAHNDLDEYIIPVTTEHDTVGGITNYSVQTTLDNSQGGSYLYAGSRGDGETSFLKSRFLIAADKAKSEIAISALMPYDTEQSGTDLLGGKTDEINTDNYTTYLFMSEDRCTLKRSENGVVLPVSEWAPTGNHIWTEFAIADGLDFTYAPLANGKYSVIFEICDTQGSFYCSEPIDLDTSNIPLRTVEENKPTVVESDGTFPLLLMEDDNAALYLDKAESALNGSTLALTKKNKNDKKLKVETDDVVCNGNISINGIAPFLSDDNNEDSSGSSSDFDFGTAYDIGALKEISSLSFNVKVCDYSTKKTLMNDRQIQINFKKGKEFKLGNENAWSTPLLDSKLSPLFGAEVSEQTVVYNSDITAKLLCFGEESKKLKGAYKIKNKTDSDIFISSEGLSIDKIYVPYNAKAVKILPGTSAYTQFSIDTDSDYGSSSLKSFGVTGMQSLQVQFRYSADRMIFWQGYGDIIRNDVKLSSKSASPSTPLSGSTVLLDENEVKISLIKYDPESKDWLMTVDNNRGEDISIDLTGLVVNGKKISDSFDFAPVYFYYSQVPAKQHSVIELFVSPLRTEEFSTVNDVQFNFRVYSFTQDKILFEGKEPVKLKAE